jgi:hypothetical protein
VSLSKALDRLADGKEYQQGAAAIRWGQLLRENPFLAGRMAALEMRERLTRFGSLGSLHSGVVTRANAFFLVRELPFAQIPGRMRVTRSDLRQIAVVVDGLDYVTRIEREFLKQVLKGPDSLKSAFSTRLSDVRLFDVRKSPEQLRAEASTGAIAYLRRGETVSYKTSADDLKGGIPAHRSQVRNRRPYWYSLQGEQRPGPRIAFPEHIDRRFVFTLVPESDSSVVIDTLYYFEPNDASSDTSFIHAGLNSLFAWYQVELRGRSQHGEGVLKVKLPDYRGVLLANPAVVDSEERARVMEAFSRLSGVGAGPSLEELGSAGRLAFDVAYLTACGFDDPEETAALLEQELRALSGERVERKLSVADAKISRRKAVSTTASVDAYAARIATAVDPYPDPRHLIGEADAHRLIPVAGPVRRPITIGTELFNLGEVNADGERVAETGSLLAAQIVRAVLLIDPSVLAVTVPKGPQLEQVHLLWQAEIKHWQEKFEAGFRRVTLGVSDVRLREAIRSAALALLHAH